MYYTIINILAALLILAYIIALIIFSYLKEGITSSATGKTLFYVAIFNSVLIILPEIKAWVIKHLPSNKSKKLANEVFEQYLRYLHEYYFIKDIYKYNYKISIFDNVTSSVSSLSNKYFSPKDNLDSRRRLIIITIFFIIIYDNYKTRFVDLFGYDIINTHIRNLFGNLTDKSQKEFLNLYGLIIVKNTKLTNVSDYFNVNDNLNYEQLKLDFFDKHIKDEYVKIITEKLSLSESKIKSFREAIKNIAESHKIDFDLVNKVFTKNRMIGKSFILTSQGNLPQNIKDYITRNPHYRLNYTSIANLPKIGNSKRIDIFYFTPSKKISSHKDLYNLLLKIDKNIQNHPLKIYEVDPLRSFANHIEDDVEFNEAILFFESSNINLNKFSSLTYQQILSLLQDQNISLRDILIELPINEYSDNIVECEIGLISKLINKYCKKDKTIFSISTFIQLVKQDIDKITDLTIIKYSQKDIITIFENKITITKFRNRLKTTVNEIEQNIRSLNELGL